MQLYSSMLLNLLQISTIASLIILMINIDQCFIANSFTNMRRIINHSCLKITIIKFVYEFPATAFVRTRPFSIHERLEYQFSSISSCLRFIIQSHFRMRFQSNDTCTPSNFQRSRTPREARRLRIPQPRTVPSVNCPILSLRRDHGEVFVRTDRYP